jgi:hypothetical protein
MIFFNGKLGDIPHIPERSSPKIWKNSQVFHGGNSEPPELENQRSDFLNSFCVGDSEVPVFSRLQNVPPKYGVGMS